jgi:hypothetical protein
MNDHELTEEESNRAEIMAAIETLTGKVDRLTAVAGRQNNIVHSGSFIIPTVAPGQTDAFVKFDFAAPYTRFVFLGSPVEWMISNDGSTERPKLGTGCIYLADGKPAIEIPFSGRMMTIFGPPGARGYICVRDGAS